MPIIKECPKTGLLIEWIPDPKIRPSSKPRSKIGFRLPPKKRSRGNNVAIIKGDGNVVIQKS